MDDDVMWGHIDAGRAGVADMLSSLSPEQWSTPSLCDGWTVRDVAVHLTQAHMGLGQFLSVAVRSGFRFNTMIRRAAQDEAMGPEQIVGALRAMVGSRRKAPGAFPLLDVIVHTQDIAVPLGIDRPMPPDAAVDSAQRLWGMRFPLHLARASRGLSFRATDCEFTIGQGPEVSGPMRDIVLVLSGRQAGLAGLSGAADRIRLGA
ncbi:maleylpyruvate isomerase family mycothiol-dependent enzyme [Mycobacteroides saopaulense]|uniref:Mycothiol-dependent maleylpyruvate isomerase metal-binding domain-containing protein n=1 Tax=Mycobacteroides saopaulense TaxID=1578165 RepID=A0A1X0JA06_9MYCO|nr:maleylpyruvate isomerase family mycothiol-dependent enzyme [Mycobacteroides saopaulense]OHT87026.1 hypothetical protein BKG68_13240 [Mycobacteroides saopaulense]OHU08884.1 hypothetical protein BKG73_17935 [Mycobacteroides saopaulense]ORB59581.1 hypothetical protein BST43_06135 [Mycobacteroides saopaulense]